MSSPMYTWDDNPDLNITPLVDVMLVLMAILMVTAPTITFVEKMDLPEGTKSVQIKEQKTLTIRMGLDKKIHINNDTYSLDTFADDFRNLSDKYDKTSDVYIRADKELKYDNVIYLLKSVKEAGFTKASLVTL